MKHYIDPNGNYHGLDNSDYIYLLPSGSVEVSEADYTAATTVHADPKAVIRAQIKELEQEQLMPRATREFMLLFMENSFTPTQLAANIGYVGMKAFDNSIKALRDQL